VKGRSCCKIGEIAALPTPGFRASFTAAALAAALMLSGCQQPAQRPACAAGQVCLEYGNGTDPSTIDPQTAAQVNESVVIGDLMMGLTTDAPDGAVLPGVAQSWETSPDGLTWTFHLRPTAWSDGKPLTAEDFVYAYRRILQPETAATYAYLVSVIKNGKAIVEGKAAPETLGAQAPDPHTLVLTLEHPVAYLPQLLQHVSFFPVPKHVVERWGEGWTQPGRMVSNGPYRLVSWRLGDYLRVEKNPHFWDAAKVCVDRIDYYPTDDVVAAERRVARGELDINTSFQSNRLPRLRRTMGDHVRTHVNLATSYMIFNTRDVPALRDPRVRRALSEAVDRDFITQKLMLAGQVAAYSFVPPGVASYGGGAATPWSRLSYPERQAEARRLLAAAGYGPERPLEIELKVSNSPGAATVTEAIQADWKTIGVKTRLARNEGQILLNAYRNRDFEVGSLLWFADYDDPLTFLELFKSDTGAQNYGDYKNPAYDALLARADQEPDVAKRAELLRAAEQLMLDADAVAPLYFDVNRALVNPRITGWVDNATHTHRARWLCVKR
jgi:oligopeptide transport system substrate-binding protein